MDLHFSLLNIGIILKKEAILISFKNNLNSNSTDSSKEIEIVITETIRKLGIKEFILRENDFELTQLNGKKSCISFNSKEKSIEKIIKNIEKKLSKECKDKNELHEAIKDIEDQLIAKRYEIYNLNITKTSEHNSNNEYTSNFLEEVAKIRNQFEHSSNPSSRWKEEIGNKYYNLQKITLKNLPEAWPMIEFALAVKCVQNIYDNDLPFMGLILAKPSTLKTTVIELFRKYPGSFYSDNFTPNSLVSHNSALNEEQLQKIDMLPKMNNKFVLTPELAPLLTSRDDDLRKVIGIITRILDGKGYESDSGAQGHRKYSDIIFSWIGAAVEIPPNVWNMLSQLGFKIYFFRPDIKEKTIQDLKKIAFCKDSKQKIKEIENALLDYLKVFDAAPTTENRTDDTNYIIKVKWNTDVEQDLIIEHISQIANILASLRGTVSVFEHRSRQYQKIKEDNTDNPTEDLAYQTEYLDYEINPQVIEDKPRALIQLKNLALGNAISMGRDYINEQDVRLVIKVAFSTTMIYRSRILELLLKNNGELTTSKIIAELKISRPKARQTMREFQALGIAKVLPISGYLNSELKIHLNEEFNWFLSKEFEKLRKPSSTVSIHPDFTRDTISFYNNMQYQSIIVKNLNSNYYTEACNHNNNCHTLKANSPPEADIKNDNNKTNSEFSENNQSTENEINTNQKTDDGNKNIENYNKQEIENKINNPKGSNLVNIQKNSASLGTENFQRVTVSHENCHKKFSNVSENVTSEILDIIRNENGIISLGYSLQLACQKSETVRNYFKDEKLTSRESRKVRTLFVEIIRHHNIQVIERKPELVVKWIAKGNERTDNN